MITKMKRKKKIFFLQIKKNSGKFIRHQRLICAKKKSLLSHDREDIFNISDHKDKPVRLQDNRMHA